MKTLYRKVAVSEKEPIENSTQVFITDGGIRLSTEFIKDLAEEIKKLESERKEMEQAEDLPF